MQNRFWATAQLYCEIVLQALQLYCKREGRKNCSEKKKLYCNTLVCIAKKKAVGFYCKMDVYCIAGEGWESWVVSQYTEVYCDCGAKARVDCIAIQCLAKPRYGQEAHRQ